MSESETDPAAVLFAPLEAGELRLRNRIVMAPLTRNRADHATDAPLPMHVEYYAQRASAGLIVSEATQISPQGKGYAFTPGIYDDAQIAGWRAVTDAVHAKGGTIVLQLWHVGRVSHPSLQPGGALPVAPSAMPFEAQVFDGERMVDCVPPRALDAAELPGIVDDFRRAARNAIAAGFDGVEVHAANGYLLQEFLATGSNARTDAYGGSAENRARFPIEVVTAVAAEAGAGRTGVRISPVTDAGGVSDDAPAESTRAFLAGIAPLGLAYLHVIEGQTGGPRDVPGVDYAEIKRAFPGAYIANNGYDRELAISELEADKADAICFGVPFIANPDLVERFRRNAPLNEADKETFYGGGEHGYTDYPTLAQAEPAGAR